MTIKNNLSTKADISGQKSIKFDPFKQDSSSGLVFGKTGSGKSFLNAKQKEIYLKECEEVENAPIQFYR